MTENENAKTFNSQFIFTNQQLQDRIKDFAILHIETYILLAYLWLKIRPEVC